MSLNMFSGGLCGENFNVIKLRNINNKPAGAQNVRLNFYKFIKNKRYIGHKSFTGREKGENHECLLKNRKP
jgi:hypothetical protein